MNLSSSSGARSSIFIRRSFVIAVAAPTQAPEHLAQVFIPADGNDHGDERESDAGHHQTDRPEHLPVFHSASCTACGAVAGRPTSEPTTRPVAANPNAAKPVTFSLQWRKKNGMIAPAAPASIAR